MPITVPFRGVIEIVGEHDTGKTIAALQTVHPYKKTVFVDDDLKGDGTVRQMRESGVEFEDYINLGELRSKLGKTPTADQLLNDIVYPTVEKLANKKHDVIVWDTWRIVYQSARAHVERNQQKYSNVVKFQGNSTIIQGLVSRVARMIERTILEELRTQCELLVITHHVKDNYLNNVVVGKIPESSRTFDEICNMRLWLRRNQMSKVPVVLFLKRPSLPKVIKGKMTFVNIVPLKITPTNKHESIWDAIGDYVDNPIQSRLPRPDETPTAEELATISGTMTAEQKQFVMKMISYQEKMADEIGTALAGTTPTVEFVPVNGVQLLTAAMTRHHVDSGKLCKLLDLSVQEITQLEGEELIEAWDKVVQNE